MSYCRLKLIFLVLVLFIATVVEARWASHGDAQFEIKFFNEDIIINQDGTSESIIETQEKVLNERGVRVQRSMICNMMVIVRKYLL